MTRCVAVPISLSLWQGLMVEGNEIGGPDRIVRCTKGLPEGAELVNSFYEGNPPCCFLIFEHPSFVDIPTGGTFPRLVPEFKIVECGVVEKILEWSQ